MILSSNFTFRKYCLRLLYFFNCGRGGIRMKRRYLKNKRVEEKLNERKWVWSCYHISALKCRMKVDNIYFRFGKILHNTPNSNCLYIVHKINVIRKRTICSWIIEYRIIKYLVQLHSRYEISFDLPWFNATKLERNLHSTYLKKRSKWYDITV